MSQGTSSWSTTINGITVGVSVTTAHEVRIYANGEETWSKPMPDARSAAACFTAIIASLKAASEAARNQPVRSACGF